MPVEDHSDESQITPDFRKEILGRGLCHINQLPLENNLDEVGCIQSCGGITTFCFRSQPITASGPRHRHLGFKACKHMFHRFMEHTAVPRKHRLDQISNVGRERLVIAGSVATAS